MLLLHYIRYEPVAWPIKLVIDFSPTCHYYIAIQFELAPYRIFMRVTCGGIENTEHVRRWRCPEAFLGADQGIKVTSELLKIKNAQLQFDLWPPENQAIRSLEGKIKRSNAHFTNHKTWSQSQTLQQATIPCSGWLDQRKWSTLKAA